MGILCGILEEFIVMIILKMLINQGGMTSGAEGWKMWWLALFSGRENIFI